MFERFHQLGGTRRRHFGRAVQALALMHDPIDAAEINGRLQVAALDLSPQIRRQINPVLNQPAVHIDEVERTVGAIVGIDRAKAFVS